MDERARRVAAWFELPILVAALLVIPVIAIEQSSVGEPWRTIAGIVNWAIWLVFSLELVAMLIVVRDRWRWLREHPLEVVTVVLTPPVLPASLQSVRALRALRLLRLLRVARIARRLFTLQGLRYAALLAVLTALGGGAAFSSVETGASAWDGVSWVVATMTTVGYGDVVPHTTSGRLIGIAVMVVGIGFLSLLIGAVAQRFVETEIREEAAEAEEDVVREVDAVRDEIVRELRSLAQRLRDPERSVEGLGG